MDDRRRNHPGGGGDTTERPNSARVYDYLLGGKDNYKVDREVADAAAEAFPGIRQAFRANRAFMQRAVRFLAEQGVRQFLDVGTGIPTEPNLHQIVQKVAPESRIVYVDNDPVVLAHAEALMVGDPRGAVAYLQADARDPKSVLDSAHFRDTFDLERPVALSVFALLHFLEDTEATNLVRTIVSGLAPGSYVALSHGTFDLNPREMRGAAAQFAASGVSLHARSKDQITEMFLDGLEIVEPGIAVLHRWRPDSSVAPAEDADIGGYGVVARVPSPD